MEPFIWTTEHYHPDNNFTMQEFLNDYLPDGFDVILEDGTYAEIQSVGDDSIYGVRASGNGDSFNHKIEFEFLR